MPSHLGARKPATNPWELDTKARQPIRARLHETALLPADWDTYGAEPPNALARELTGRVLTLLEESALCPSQLRANVEGGITISFASGARRALMEMYNTGEIVAAVYSAGNKPAVWEPGPDELRSTIWRLRVHLANLAET